MNYLTDTTQEQRQATVSFIRWHRAFIRSKTPYAKIPGNQWGETMSQMDAQRSLFNMVDNAINGKANISWPKKASQDYQTSLRRDQRRIRDRVLQRVRVYQFETAEARTRFAHFLSSYADDAL